MIIEKKTIQLEAIRQASFHPDASKSELAELIAKELCVDADTVLSALNSEE